MPIARKRAQGQQRRLRKFLARLPNGNDDDDDDAGQREFERSVSEQLGPHHSGVADLVRDMEALRALQARIRAAT